jgi:hypothetical protein
MIKKDNEYYLKEFIEGLLEQQRGIHEDLGRKFVKKQEVRYSKAVDKLRESEEGVKAFTCLLDHDNPKVSLTAAVYLLKTSAAEQAVDIIRRFAQGPEDDFNTICARLRLEDWENQKSGQ